MNDQTLVETIDQALGYLMEADMALEGGVLARIRDARSGQLRSPTLEAGGSTSPSTPDDNPSLPKEYVAPVLRGNLDYSDPTGRAAVHALNYGDQAEADRNHIDRLARSIRRDANRLVLILARYNQRPATFTEQATATKESGGEPGCDSCARVDSPGTVGRKHNQRTPWWNPVARNVTLENGKVAALCEWCRVIARETGQLPLVEDVVSYRDTGRARRRTA